MKFAKNLIIQVSLSLFGILCAQNVLAADKMLISPTATCPADYAYMPSSYLQSNLEAVRGLITNQAKGDDLKWGHWFIDGGANAFAGTGYNWDIKSVADMKWTTGASLCIPFIIIAPSPTCPVGYTFVTSSYINSNKASIQKLITGQTTGDDLKWGHWFIDGGANALGGTGYNWDIKSVADLKQTTKVSLCTVTNLIPSTTSTASGPARSYGWYTMCLTPNDHLALKAKVPVSVGGIPNAIPAPAGIRCPQNGEYSAYNYYGVNASANASCEAKNRKNFCYMVSGQGDSGTAVCGPQAKDYNSDCFYAPITRAVAP